jgi:hypothetical protein
MDGKFAAKTFEIKQCTFRACAELTKCFFCPNLLFLFQNKQKLEKSLAFSKRLKVLFVQIQPIKTLFFLLGGALDKAVSVQAPIIIVKKTNLLVIAP